MDKQVAHDLLAQHDISTKMFSLAGLECYARLVAAHDCDTAKMVLAFRDGAIHQIIVRVMGIDAAEMTSKDPVVKAWAVRARNRLLSLLAPGVFTVDGTYSKKDIVRLLSENVALVWLKVGEQDKYGRVLSDLYYSPEDKETIQSILIKEGYAKPYFGATKSQWVADDCVLKGSE